MKRWLLFLLLAAYAAPAGAVDAGTPFWTDFWVSSAGAWRACWFKVYYDSTKVLPIRYLGVTGGCRAEFDDIAVSPRQAKVDTLMADADVWIMYDKGTANADSAMVGSVQFLPIASGDAIITTSPAVRAKHPLSAGGSCLAYQFGALNADTEAAIVVNSAGTVYTTPASSSWTVAADTVTIAANNDSTGCAVAKFDNHPPKEGGWTPAGAYCAPLAMVITAKDSTISPADTLYMRVNVWADSVTSIEGYIEYTPTADSSGTIVPANTYVGFQRDPYTAFTNFQVIGDFDTARPGAITQRCSAGWNPAAVSGPYNQNKILYFKASKPNAVVSHHDTLGVASEADSLGSLRPLLTLKFLAGNVNDTFAAGIPSGACAPTKSYTTTDPNHTVAEAQSWCEFKYGAIVERGGTLVFDPARAVWLNDRIVFLRNLSQYTIGSP